MSEHGGYPLVTPSSGNVFADPGFDNADEELAKADLAIAISRAMQARGLSEAAAEALGTSEPNLASIIRGREGDVTLETLFACANRLGDRVRVHVEPVPAETGSELARAQ